MLLLISKKVMHLVDSFLAGIRSKVSHNSSIYEVQQKSTSLTEAYVDISSQ